MKVSVSLPEEVVKTIDEIINRRDSPSRNRSSLIAAALEDFLTRNYPEYYIKSIKAKVVKPTVLPYLEALSSARFKMRSPRLRGRRIDTQWIEIP